MSEAYWCVMFAWITIGLIFIGEIIKELGDDE